jgi:hypothetical protein
MSIIRTEKTDNYTVICNQCLRDPALSARAKGIFAYIMTLPSDWKLYKSELHAHFTEGRDAINTAFSELETAGYISKQTGRLENGSLNGWDYTIYESTELLETRNTGNPSDGEPASTKYSSSPSTKKTNLSAGEKSASKPEVQKSERKGVAELELCRRLIDGVSEKLGRKLISKPSSTPILKLYRSGIKEEEVRKAIDWLIEHAGEQYAPVVQSGAALVEKWDKVQAAITRSSTPPHAFKPKIIADNNSMLI